jgi:hypothetical protein
MAVHMPCARPSAFAAVMHQSIELARDTSANDHDSHFRCGHDFEEEVPAMAECPGNEGDRSRCDSARQTGEIWTGFLLLALLISSMKSKQYNEDDG